MNRIWLGDLIDFWNKLHFSKVRQEDVFTTWTTDNIRQIPVRDSMRKQIEFVAQDLKAIEPYFKRHDLGYDDYLKVTRAIRCAELDAEYLGYELNVDFSLTKVQAISTRRGVGN